MLPRASILLVVACIQCARQHQQPGSSPEPLEEFLTEEDRRFCSGEFKLSYPGVNISSCMIIPHEFRKMISQEWDAPQVTLTTADQILDPRIQNALQLYNTAVVETSYQDLRRRNLNETKAAFRQERRASEVTGGERTLDGKSNMFAFVSTSPGLTTSENEKLM